MVIVDSLDERLLDCAFCGKKFFDTPDMALFGWDDDSPIYACMACDTAQQSVQPTVLNVCQKCGNRINGLCECESPVQISHSG